MTALVTHDADTWKKIVNFYIVIPLLLYYLVNDLGFKINR